MRQTIVKDEARAHYIPGLDGLRALAILAVLGYHLLPGLLPGGYIGVDIFFVISGFLITTLLITEQLRSGKIHLRRFWWRRARRLLPALCVTIIIAAAAALFVRGDILVGLGRQILGAATFSNNWVEVAAGANYFDADNTHLLTNFWSLAVEEQFYLIWPLILTGVLSIAWLAKRPKFGVGLCIAGATSSAFAMAWLFAGTNATRVYYGTDTHIFGLMIGAAVAFWARSRVTETMLRRLYQPFWSLPKARTQHVGLAAGIGLLILMVLMSDKTPLAYYGGLLLASLLAAALLVATISAPAGLQRIFTWRPVAWIGVRSYGIYLWHWPILVLLTHALPASTLWWLVPSLTTCLAIGFATVSYRYLEVPIRREGFRAYLSRGIKRRAVIVDNAILGWKVRPHPVLVSAGIIVVLAVGAVVSAPTKTQAQLSIEAGQAAIKKSQQVHEPATFASPSPQPSRSKPAVGGVNDSGMTIIGDSVTIASAPALQARFPGVMIDAEISRSMREGGLSAIDKLVNAGQLRSTIVIALATNGYFGTGNLDRIVTQLSGHKLVFVTAHVNREWTAANNNDLHQLAQKYPNVVIAEWNDAITAHPEDLGDDSIHPNAQGGTVYANCIDAALKRLR